MEREAMSDKTTPSANIADSGVLILIAEDAPEIAEILAAYLARNGMRSVHASDGARALEMHLALKPDLVLLDIQMPQVNGWQVLSQIRQRGDTPVILLTALDQDVDKLTGLRIGADDYVVKPFNPAEVVARVEAVLRRSQPREDRDLRRILRAPPFVIDFEQHEAVAEIDGTTHTLVLTLTEFKLLAQLARAPRRVFTRAELLTSCLPEGDTLERTVDSHVSKLEDLGIAGIPVSIRGVGYRFQQGS
jgi:two-component system response regulator AdeR